MCRKHHLLIGILTDIGNVLGQALRKDSDSSLELWKLKVHVPLLFSFLAGGLLGQICFLRLDGTALLIPFFFIGSIAIAYLALPIVAEAKAYFEQEDILQRERIEEFRAAGLMGNGRTAQEGETDIREFLNEIKNTGTLDARSLNRLFASNNGVVGSSRIADIDAQLDEESPLLST